LKAVLRLSASVGNAISRAVRALAVSMLDVNKSTLAGPVAMRGDGNKKPGWER